MSRHAVLLIGGTGFIGNALAIRLKKEDFGVYVVGRHDHDRLEPLIRRCNTVIHLASSTTPASSATSLSLESTNLALTKRLLELLQGHPQVHLIFFSSGGTVYGDPAQLPVSEDATVAPLSNYGTGKVAQENLCKALRSRGHAVTILRPSNVYGPGQSIRHGFGLVRTMLEHALHGTSLEIWGDGENVRDFIYIDDMVEACIRMVQSAEDAQTYNVGSGIGYSINQVRGIVETMCHVQLEAIHRPARGIDVRSVVLDSSRLNVRLGWKPAVGLEEGVARTWQWLKRP